MPAPTLLAAAVVLAVLGVLAATVVLAVLGVLAATLVVAAVGVAASFTGIAVVLAAGVAVPGGVAATATLPPGPVVPIPVRALSRARVSPLGAVAVAAAVPRLAPLAGRRPRRPELLLRPWVCEHRRAGGRRCDDPACQEEQTTGGRRAPGGASPLTRRGGHRASKSSSRHRSAPYPTR